MKKIVAYFTLENCLYLFVILAAFLKVLKTGPIFSGDTHSYFDMDIYRTIGYASYVNLHKVFFGTYFIKAIIISQFGFSSFAVWFLVKAIRTTTELNKWFALILFLVLIIPVFMGVSVANWILSEGLAYPLYLIVVAHILYGMIVYHDE